MRLRILVQLLCLWNCWILVVEHVESESDLTDWRNWAQSLSTATLCLDSVPFILSSLIAKKGSGVWPKSPNALMSHCPVPLDVGLVNYSTSQYTIYVTLMLHRRVCQHVLGQSVICHKICNIMWISKIDASHSQESVPTCSGAINRRAGEQINREGCQTLAGGAHKQINWYIIKH